MSNEILSCVFATTFLVLVTEVVWHPNSNFFSKAHWMKMVSDSLESTVQLFCQFSCCLTTICLQKCLEMIFVEDGKPAGETRVVQVEVTISELDKPILNSPRSYSIYFVHVTNVTRCFRSFLTTTKSETKQMSKIDFFLVACKYIKINEF